MEGIDQVNVACTLVSAAFVDDVLTVDQTSRGKIRIVRVSIRSPLFKDRAEAMVATLRTRREYLVFQIDGILVGFHAVDI